MRAFPAIMLVLTCLASSASAGVPEIIAYVEDEAGNGGNATATWAQDVVAAASNTTLSFVQGQADHAAETAAYVGAVALERVNESATYVASKAAYAQSTAHDEYETWSSYAQDEADHWSGFAQEQAGSWSSFAQDSAGYWAAYAQDSAGYWSGFGTNLTWTVLGWYGIHPGTANDTAGMALGAANGAVGLATMLTGPLVDAVGDPASFIADEDEDGVLDGAESYICLVEDRTTPLDGTCSGSFTGGDADYHPPV